MKRLHAFVLFALVLNLTVVPAEDPFDRVTDALTFSSFDDNVRTRISGLADLEGYHFDRPAPGLIDTANDSLFNPRLALFLDLQAGPHVYVFAQSRLDRGFDPSDGGAEARMDEYALRVTPWPDGRFNLQLGQFAMVVGNWVERHLSWENPFITAPLPYEHLTAIYDSEAPKSALDFVTIRTQERYDYNPVIWGPSYATGASIAGRLGKAEYAVELKNAGLSSRPESWSVTETGFQHPTFSGRLGYRPDLRWSLGLSASAGPYFRPEAAHSLPDGRGIGDFKQTVLGQDIRFAWHRLQVWAEVYESRFEVPRVGNADALAYYVEGKFKVTPQFFAAVRWNQQFFSRISDSITGNPRWGDDLWRIDGAVGYRFTAHTQFKFQYSLLHAGSQADAFSNFVAAQFTLRF